LTWIARVTDPFAMPPPLIACPSCSCHARSSEMVCPHCGEPLRRRDGSVPRTAAAVLLGLTVAGMAGCNKPPDNKEEPREIPMAPYGVAATVENPEPIRAVPNSAAVSASAAPTPAPKASAPKGGGH